jgi:hypothetical protein
MKSTPGIYFIFLFFIFIGYNTSAQTYKDCNTDGHIFVHTEKAPKYKGQLQNYFEDAFKGDALAYTGEIITIFIIDEDGRCCCTDIQKCDSASLSAKLKDAIDRMPGWKPAVQNGHVVRFYFRLKFSFNGSDFRVTPM